MLDLDECNQILVANPFVDDGFTVPSSHNHGAPITLTLNSSPKHHPLRSRSVSPARRCGFPVASSITVVDSEGETQSRRTRPLSLDGSSADAAEEEDQTTDSGALCGSSDIIVHPVDPNDSLAGVALRYGVSIAALRRANRLWPSDPIYLRTELFIPRGNTLRARRRPTHSASTDTTLGSSVEIAPSLSPDLIASSFVAARDIFISMLPARISMESLSSRATASEDHELDDFREARVHEISNTETFLVEEAHELSTLAAPHTWHKRPGIPRSSRAPCASADKHLDDNQALPVGDLHSRCTSSSSTASQGHVYRAQPFALLPVRTSQLEPEPAMELPVRHPRI